MRIPTLRGRNGSFGARATAAGLAMTATVTLLSDPAAAGPVGEQVVIGDVTFTQSGNQWVITASDGSIIDYLSFDILANESVQFIQPGDMARVLNRINSATPTQIMGTLSANGIIYFVNPSGVVFGNGATVDVAGIVAAAGNISNADFIAGEDRFTGLSGTVENRGAITSNGGRTALLGNRVLNAGSITANGGMIAMVAGDSVWLRTIDGRMSVRVDGKDITGQAVPWAGSLSGNGTAVENTGTINAAGGQVVLGAGDIAGLAVRNSGTIMAAGGEVTMAATQGVVRNEGLVDVSGATGGTVTVQGPAVENLGTIRADGSSVRAGTIEIMGRQYTVLFPGSVLSARGTSGSADGGTIVIDTVAGTSYFAAGSSMLVNGAAGGGDGGHISFDGAGMVIKGAISLDAGSGATKGTFTLLGGGVDVIIGDDGSDDALLFDDGNVTLDELPGAGTVLLSVNSLGNVVTGSILIQSSGSILLVSDLTLQDGTDLTLEAWNNVNILAAIAGANNLTAHADFNDSGTGQVRIEVPLSVGGTIELIGNVIEIDGGSLTAGGDINLTGDTVLMSDTTMNGSSVTFAGTIEGAGDGPVSLAVNASGVTDFQQAVGAGGGLSSVTTDAGGTTRLGGNVTAGQMIFNDQLILDGAAVLTADGAVRILGGGDGAGNDLSIISGSARIAGGFSGLGVLDVSTGTVRVIDAISGQELRFDADVQLDGDTQLTGTQLIEVLGEISGTHALVVSSDGTIRFMDQVGTVFSALESLEVNGDLEIGGNAIRTLQQQVFNGSILLLADTLMNGTQITYNGTIDAAGPGEGEGFVPASLTVNASQGAAFNGQVGGTEALRSVTMNGDATLAGGLVRTRDQQVWNGDVVVDGEQVLESQQDGTISFLGTVDGQAVDADSLEVNTGGETRFVGQVGQTTRLGTLETDAAGSTSFAADAAADRILVQDELRLDADVTMTGGFSAKFLGGGDGQDHRLVIVSPRGEMRGGHSGYSSIETSGGAFKVADLMQAGEIVFLDDVQLVGNAEISGADLVHFGGEVFGTFDLEVVSDTRVEFMDDLGNAFSPLRSLIVRVDEAGNILSQNLILFGAMSSRIIALEDIQLNPNGRPAVGQVATIVALGSGLAMTSQNGDILIGPREKFTSLGSLTMNATNGSATFGDLTVVDDLAVNAPEIAIWAREAGTYLAADGSLLEDGGTDIIVGGSVVLGAAPTVVTVPGAGDVAAPVFAVATAQEIANIGDLMVVELEGFGEDALTLDEGKGGETVLDFGVLVEADNGGGDDGGDGDGGGGGGGDIIIDPDPAPEPETGDFEGTLAEFTGEELRRRRGELVDVRVPRDAIAQQTLQRLALVIRSLRPEELRSITEGRLITVDVADPSILGGQVGPTSGARVQRDALIAAGERIDALLGPAEDGETAEAAAVEIRESLLRSWAMWRADEGAAGTPVEFASWLETAGQEHASTRFTIEGLRDIARSMISMGLTVPERDAAIRPLIRSVAPATLGEAFVTDMVLGG